MSLSKLTARCLSNHKKTNILANSVRQSSHFVYLPDEKAPVEGKNVIDKVILLKIVMLIVTYSQNQFHTDNECVNL